MKMKAVHRNQCAPWILNVHYAQRWPSVSYAFGLFENGAMVGCVTYGTPPSAPLRSGICGPEMASYVMELNRLCLTTDTKNAASFLVGRSLKELPPSIVVSFADISQGHVGYVYQASNFIYCGLSAKRTDWKVKGREHLHGQTVADEFRGCKDRAKKMREKYGEDFYLSPRPRKHRYVYVTGSKSFRKKALKNLRYKTGPYPKSIGTRATQHSRPLITPGLSGPGFL